MLNLTQELRNVSRACKVLGYSCQPFYEIRRNYPSPQCGRAAGQAVWLQGASSPIGLRPKFWYDPVEQMQQDLDRYCTTTCNYNHERSPQDRMMEGRTYLDVPGSDRRVARTKLATAA